jgi:hypothetical protein
MQASIATHSSSVVHAGIGSSDIVAVAVLVHRGIVEGSPCMNIHRSLAVVDVPLTGTGATRLNV